VDTPAHPRIIVIGSDASLSYLIGRYAEQGGYWVANLQVVPSPAEARALQPAAILFQSVESLEASQTLIRDLAECDFPPVLVCSSVTDEARARELGADRCLLHPLTYDSVVSALTSADR
jgi:DNA-binding response OmpR family regulator